jgi:hypothetical protein
MNSNFRLRISDCGSHVDAYPLSETNVNGDMI